MEDTKQLRVLAAVLGGKNLGFELPTPGFISHLLGWQGSRQRDTPLEAIVPQMWSGYVDSDSMVDEITEECRGYHEKLLTMDQLDIKMKFREESDLVGLGLGPMEIQLDGRLEVKRLMLRASFHYADDSAKEWGAADNAKREACKIMVSKRWSATNIMNIHKWVNPIYPVEDSLNGALNVCYESFDVLKEMMQDDG